jgi:hypothetical protein
MMASYDDWSNINEKDEELQDSSVRTHSPLHSPSMQSLTSDPVGAIVFSNMFFFFGLANIDN